jgi:hypothetical protein
LPPARLAKSFGASVFYPPGRIQAGITAPGSDPRRRDPARAAFTAEPDHARSAAGRPDAMRHAEARERFPRWKPSGFSSWNPLTIESPGD